MPHVRLRRQIGAVVLVLASWSGATSLGAQQARPGALDSARTATDTVKKKSPQVAAALGFFPGAGHWYAGEVNRGWLITAVYFTAVAIGGNGRRTDAWGKVAGVAMVGGLVAGIVDGSNAARRTNDRIDRERARRKGATAGSTAATDAVGRGAATGLNAGRRERGH